MPRRHRIKGNDIHYHIILRCNNKERLFQQFQDFSYFLKILRNAKSEYFFELYNYELLNSHVHLFVSTHANYFIDKIMHNICFRYAKYYNQYYGRTGHFWAHRYRSHVILDDRYALACLRYQHRNAMMAGLAPKPELWPWSGYKFYGCGESNDLLEHHSSFMKLSDDMHLRRLYYKQLVNQELPSDRYKYIIEKAKRIESRRLSEMISQVHQLKRDIKTTMGCLAPYGTEN